MPGPDGQPAYVEFRIGDYQHELGLIDSRFAPHRNGESSGEIIFWHVDDVQAAVDRLLAMGARADHAAVGGVRHRLGRRPFGKILGVMHKPHYLEILRARG